MGDPACRLSVRMEYGAAAAPKGPVRPEEAAVPDAVPPDAASDSRAPGRSDGRSGIVPLTVKLGGIGTFLHGVPQDGKSG